MSPPRPCRTGVLPTAALVACLAAAGCKVGPDYHAPSVEAPESFHNATTQAAVDSEQATWVDWWTRFDDPELDALVSRALAANHEMAVARARVQEARAIERIAQSRLYPTVDLSAAVLKTRGSAAGFGFPYGAPGMDNSLFQLGFDASYEVDLFGGV